MKYSLRQLEIPNVILCKNKTSLLCGPHVDDSSQNTFLLEVFFDCAVTFSVIDESAWESMDWASVMHGVKTKIVITLRHSAYLKFFVTEAHVSQQVDFKSHSVQNVVHSNLCIFFKLHNLLKR